MSWVDQDKAIGEWIAEHGVEAYEECPIIRRTMLYGGSEATNADWQAKHVDMLMDFGYDFEKITEIGAGTGQFAKQLIEWGQTCSYIDEYRIYDLPNIQHVQEYVMGYPEGVVWDTQPQAMEDCVIVSLFALSEMPYGERRSVLDAIGRHNAMFFAFQKQHECYDNWYWFVGLAEFLGREFTISPIKCDRNDLYYMYVEGE